MVEAFTSKLKVLCPVQSPEPATSTPHPGAAEHIMQAFTKILLLFVQILTQYQPKQVRPRSRTDPTHATNRCIGMSVTMLQTSEGYAAPRRQKFWSKGQGPISLTSRFHTRSNTQTRLLNTKHKPNRTLGYIIRAYLEGKS